MTRNPLPEKITAFENFDDDIFWEVTKVSWKMYPESKSGNPLNKWIAVLNHFLGMFEI